MLEIIQQFDESLALFFQSIQNPITNIPMIIITTLGDEGIFWIVLAVILFFFKKTRKVILILVAAVGLCLVCNNMILKNIFSRERPFVVLESIELLIEAPSSYSFPSGHSVSSLACATTLFITYKNSHKWVAIGAMVLAVLIAFSRLYLCVHFFTDVLVGSLLGVVLGIVAVYAINFAEKKWIQLKKK